MTSVMPRVVLTREDARELTRRINVKNADEGAGPISPIDGQPHCFASASILGVLQSNEVVEIEVEL